MSEVWYNYPKLFVLSLPQNTLSCNTESVYTLSVRASKCSHQKYEQCSPKYHIILLKTYQQEIALDPQEK